MRDVDLVELIPRRTILGVDVTALGRTEAVELLLRRLASRTLTQVSFANANLLTLASKDPSVHQALRRMLIFNDGIGTDLASWLLHGCRFPENLNGTDLTPMLLAALPRHTRVYLYGARPEVVARAAAALQAAYPITVCGWRDGYSVDEGTVAEELERARADVVLVALGNPLQERWIAANAERTRAALVIGVGAYFDFATGTVPRAPRWVRALRSEWLFRLLLEPRRLWKRYTVDVARFALAVCAEKTRRIGGVAP